MVNIHNLNTLWKQQVAIAQIERAAWEHASPSWKAQTDMFKFVMGGQRPREARLKPMRREDIPTWLQKHKLNPLEAMNVWCQNTMQECHKVLHKKRGCKCRFAWRHDNITTGRCWLCTAERPI